MNRHASILPHVHTSASSAFWQKKRVFLTGHTGFKGSWLTIWLDALGAKVYGYALKPPTRPSLFEDCRLGKLLAGNTIADIRDFNSLSKRIRLVKPDIVIHMAAQPIVRDSYVIPRETYEVNVMGTANLLESVRLAGGCRAVLNVTTDKIYENKERLKGYKEGEPLGGYDPYSSSKACSELVTSAYRNSFFNPDNYFLPGRHHASTPPRLHASGHCVALATARAGNVIGGGDWAQDRLVPDIVRAILGKKPVFIRNPRSIRPWQHVLESLSGYLALCEKLYTKGGKFSRAWNFGPSERDAMDVEWIAKRLLGKFECNKGYTISKGRHPHEARYLKLDSTMARRELGWTPRWGIGRALDSISDWVRAYQAKEDMLEVCRRQIREYVEDWKIRRLAKDRKLTTQQKLIKI